MTSASITDLEPHSRPTIDSAPQVVEAWALLEAANRLAAVQQPTVDRGILLDVVRLNFSHGTADDHLQRAELLRSLCVKTGRTVGIMVDLQGPKIRLGRFADGPHELAVGDVFTITVEDIQRELDRRRVGQSKVSSARQESDTVQILSGVFEDRTTGAPISMLRIESAQAPYEVFAKKSIAKLADLKGKIIMVDAARGITRFYMERMLVANGVKSSEIDFVYAGATSQRYAALQSGSIDATILVAPFNFRARSDGFTNLGSPASYARDVPFGAVFVNNAWARQNRATASRRCCAVPGGACRSTETFFGPSRRGGPA